MAGALLDSELPRQCRLTYLAEGGRRSLPFKVWYALSSLTQLSWLLLRRKIDLLHLHVGDGASFYRHVVYLTLGWLTGVPVILHMHVQGPVLAQPFSTANRMARWLLRWAVDHATRVVVLSTAWATALAQHSGRTDSIERIVVMANLVDCQRIQPPDDPTTRGPGVVLYLGDFSPGKGVHDLLAAAPAVLRDHPTARFVIAGGHPPAGLVGQAGRLGDAVRFPGFVRGADKLGLLHEAAFLVLPSYSEGVPVAVLEAMAAGLPVVATPVGGLPDFFSDGVNGLLVNPGDVSGLASAISHLLANDSARQTMGQHNRQQALEQFSVPQYVQRLLQVYCDALS